MGVGNNRVNRPGRPISCDADNRLLRNIHLIILRTPVDTAVRRITGTLIIARLFYTLLLIVR